MLVVGALSIPFEAVVVAVILMTGIGSIAALLWRIRLDRRRAAFVALIGRKTGTSDDRILSVFKGADIDLDTYRIRIKKTGFFSFSAMAFDLRRAGLPPYPVLIFIFAAVLSLVVAMVVFWLPGVSLALQAALLFPIMLWLSRRSFINMFIDARKMKMIGQMIDFLEYVRRAALVGYSPERAIIEAIGEVGNPLQAKLMSVRDLSSVGADFIDSLQISANQIDLPEYDIFASALEAQASAGGSIAGVLGDVVEITRLRLDVQRKISTLTGEGRFNAILLGSLPIALMLYVRYSDPRFFSVMWQSSMGYGIYMTTVALAFIGAFIAIRIANVKL